MTREMKKATKDMIVWKKARRTGFRTFCLVKLRLTKGTTYLHAQGPALSECKCRAAKATVVGFYSIKLKRRFKDTIEVHSDYDPLFKYQIDKIVKPRRYPFDRAKNQCSSGIHFFFKQNDAARYKI